MMPVAAMKAALWMTSLSALALIVAIYCVQKQYGLDKYRLGDVKANYSVDLVKELVEDPKRAAAYVVPILFPLDLLFIASFGAFLILCSTYFAGAAGIPAHWIWILTILPVIYMGADLSENALQARMLTDQDAINEHMVAVTQSMTRLKYVVGASGLGQTIVVVVLALLRRA